MVSFRRYRVEDHLGAAAASPDCGLIDRDRCPAHRANGPGMQARSKLSTLGRTAEDAVQRVRPGLLVIYHVLQPWSGGDQAGAPGARTGSAAAPVRKRWDFRTTRYHAVRKGKTARPG